MSLSTPAQKEETANVMKCSVNINLLRQIFFEFNFQPIFSVLLIFRIKRSSLEHKLNLILETFKVQYYQSHIVVEIKSFVG